MKPTGAVEGRKIAVICRSDSTGGAAVVSRRLTEALIAAGADARLLVMEKLTDAPYVVKVGFPLRSRVAFLLERLQIFFSNGLSRRNLFKVDTAAFGLPLWLHPVVREADTVILNWVNQGMLSLKGVRRICRSGKRVFWTMHDMWNMTGVCHHAGECTRFGRECGCCPLLNEKGCAGKGRADDLSSKVWRRKKELYAGSAIRFVAVSNWLVGKAAESSLLGAANVRVIPNAFDFSRIPALAERPLSNGKRILFAAATLDNWIKGLEDFKAGIRIFATRYPLLAANCEVTLLGSVKNPHSLEGFALPSTHLGFTSSEDDLTRVYMESDVIANCSQFENLPGTLVEGQACGCIPVAFRRGGQGDIIEHETTGYLMEWSSDPSLRAEAIAEGLAWAIERSGDAALRERMRRSAEERFAAPRVAASYLSAT